MREKRQRKTLPVVLATAVIVTMCFAGIHLTANAASGNRPGTPKITKATAGQTSVKLTWSKAKKARGYIVYMYNGRKYVKIKTLKARTYTVKNLKAYATYKFRVRAYNNTKRKTYYGSVSNTKKINTKAAHVKAYVSDVTVNSGSTATFTVTVTAGSKPYKYQWYKDSKAIKGATSRSYTTKKLSTSDSGTKYTCRVTNPAGYVKVKGTLTVIKKVFVPLSVYVADQSAATGSAATFSVAASNGSGNYTYQWYQKSIENTDFVKIDGATSSAYSPQTGTTGKVTMHNNGTEYKCVVKDSSSTTVSATGKLTVTGTTKIGSWNVGAENDTTGYVRESAKDNVVATLYSDGELALTGSGKTAYYESITPSGIFPWLTDPYIEQIKSSTIASTVKPALMSNWYSNCLNLIEAPTIPSSVTTMHSTFDNCPLLKKAPVLPLGVEDITGAFQSCTSLTEAPEIPSSVTNMVQAFENCSSLTKAPKIPKKVEDMSMAFEWCTSLKEAPLIPAGVMYMNGTFKKCTSLTKAPEIPKSVTLMPYTFEGCSSLTDAPEIPSGVTNMDGTFKDCTSITKAPEIPSGMSTMKYTFENCTSLVTGPSTIPSEVINMEGTFNSCSKLDGEMLIKAAVTRINITDCFKNASTANATQLRLNFTSENNSNFDKIIVTKNNPDSHIIKGIQI